MAFRIWSYTLQVPVHFNRPVFEYELAKSLSRFRITESHKKRFKKFIKVDVSVKWVTKSQGMMNGRGIPPPPTMTISKTTGRYLRVVEGSAGVYCCIPNNSSWSCPGGQQMRQVIQTSSISIWPSPPPPQAWVFICRG